MYKLLNILDDDTRKIAADDPKQIIENFFRIVDKSGRVVPFILNEAQAMYYDKMTARDDILKARKEGFSSLILAIFTVKFLFLENVNCVCISHEADSTARLFDKVEFYVNNLFSKNGEKIEVNLTDKSRKRMVLKYNKKSKDGNEYTVTNTFYVGTAGAKAFGRGDTIHYLHGSEIAFWDDASRILTGLLNAVPDDLTNTQVVKESTANGSGTQHHTEWKNEKMGASVFTPHFFGWFLDPTNKMPTPKGFTRTPEEDAIAAKVFVNDGVKLTNQQLYWRRWKISSMQPDGTRTKEELFKQEYPCIVKGTLVSDGIGIKKIEDVSPNGFVFKVFNNGEKETVEIITRKGYSVRCTPEHRIKTVNRGFVEAKELSTKDKVILRPLPLGKKNMVVETDFIFSKLRTEITKELAEFIGIYMGDGDFYYRDEEGQSSNPSVGVACDRACPDFIEHVEVLYSRFLGGSGKKISGSKKGCVYIRKSNKDFKVLFDGLGLIKRRDSNNGYKRKITVPWYIFSSPKSVVAAFLRGLFETDGFVDKDGRRIILFSKYKGFLQDIQLLLLSFGISSRINEVQKRSNNYRYIGYELILRKEANLVFRKEVGFISNKKRERLAGLSSDGNGNAIANETGFDYFKETRILGKNEVWDLTTKTSEFVANGIVVHNCSDVEAFLSTGKSIFDEKVMSWYEEAHVRPPDVTGELVGWDPPFLLEGETGRLSIWYTNGEAVLKDRTYVIGADTSEGGDYSYAVVLDRNTLTQVAEFQERMDPYEFANVLYRMGKYWNDALIGCERNNQGIAVVTKLDELGYDNQYRRETLDEITKKIHNELGWRTDSVTRPIMLSDYNQVVTERKYIFHSRILLEQQRSFVRNKKGRPEAAFGANDDAVISNAIAYQMYKHVPEPIAEGEIMVRNYSPGHSLSNFLNRNK